MPSTRRLTASRIAKSSALPFNVEYTLNVLRCKKRALSDAEKELVAVAMPIDAKFIRQTPAEIKALLEKITSGASEDEPAAGVDGEAISDLG